MAIKKGEGTHHPTVQVWTVVVKQAGVLKWKDALRVGVGVGIFAIAAVVFDYWDRLEHGARDLHQWSQGCLWGAITLITINSPVLGKIAKTSFERCLGTLVGGWLGCACFLVSRHPAWVACISFALAIASSMLAVKLKLDYSCKLLSITFILVLWTPQSDGQALYIAYTRVSCIILAVLIMGLLSMLIYPQVASEQVLAALSKAMDSTATLNKMVWEEVTSKCREQSYRLSESFRLKKGLETPAPILSDERQSVNGSTLQQQRDEAALDYRSVSASASVLAAAARQAEAEVAHNGPAESATAPAPEGEWPDAASGDTSGRRPTDSSACSTSAAEAGSRSGSTAKTLYIKKGLGAAYRAHEARCRGLAAESDAGRAGTDAQTAEIGSGDDTGKGGSEEAARSRNTAATSSHELGGGSGGPLGAKSPTEKSAAEIDGRGGGGSSSRGGVADGVRRRLAWCISVCCGGLSGDRKFAAKASEDTDAMHQLDAEEKAAAEKAALEEGFVGHAELEREKPFFEAMLAVRTQQVAAEEHLATALSEMYVGSWCGRRWFVPTVFYQNQAHDKQAWHMPEKLIKRLAMRMRRVLRVLYMLHATFRDGFESEVVEELEHHFPLKLLMELSDAAAQAVQAFTEHFPKPGRPVAGPMPEEPMQHLQDVVAVLLALAHTSRQHKVELILLGEEVRKVVAAGSAADGEQLRRLRALWRGSRLGQLDGEELFLFPNNEAGWLATTRWNAFHFLVQQLVDSLARLRITLNLMLPRLPGADLSRQSAHDLHGDMSPTPSETAEHHAQQGAAHLQERDREKVHVVVEG